MLRPPGTGPIPEGVRLRIGDVADLTGLSLRSIRHYEDLGLVRPTDRTDGGFRLYDADAVERLRLVMALKLLDLPLDEIAVVVAACRAIEDGEADAEDVARIVACRDDVNSTLARLVQAVDAARALGARLDAALDSALDPVTSPH